MIVKGKNVVGLKIITVDTGSIIETVDDIAYNPSTQRVEALLVSSGGIFSSARAIHMDDVKNIGDDAVVVHDASVIKSVKDLGDSVHSISDSNKHLVKTNVMTVDGKELGKVTDIYFDSQNGMVESMEVSQGGLKTLSEGKKSIKPSDIVTIGADATIVSSYIEAKLEDQGEEGGLKGKLNDAKEKAAEIATSAKETAQDVAENVKETSKDVAENVKEKSIDLKDAAQEKAADANEVVKDKSADAKDFIDEKSAEAKVKAQELKDDTAQKGRELSDSVSEKTAELKIVAADKSDEARIKADELTETTRVKAAELRDTAETKAIETKEKIDELAVHTKDRSIDAKEKIKDRVSRADTTNSHKSNQVVEQTKKKYEDDDKMIEIETTTIEK